MNIPDHVTTYLVLARAFIAVGDYASAEQALERWGKQSPLARLPLVPYAKSICTSPQRTQEKQAATLWVACHRALPSGLQSALQEASGSRNILG